MYPKSPFRVHISGNMYPKSPFRVHINGNMYPKSPFRVHISGNMYPKSPFRVHILRKSFSQKTSKRVAVFGMPKIKRRFLLCKTPLFESKNAVFSYEKRRFFNRLFKTLIISSLFRLFFALLSLLQQRLDYRHGHCDQKK